MQDQQDDDDDRPDVPGDTAPPEAHNAPEADPSTLPVDEGDQEADLKEEPA